MTLLDKIRLSRKFGKITYIISAILTVAMSALAVSEPTAVALRGNVKALCREGVRLDPVWLHAIRILPTFVVICVLREVFASKFASVFMRPHAISGREEMAFLHELFYSATCVGPFFDKTATAQGTRPSIIVKDTSL